MTWEAEHSVPEFTGALLSDILRRISIVYWNINQEEWDEASDPRFASIEYRAYYWGDDEEMATLPNFKFRDVEIRWYKYPRRGMTTNKPLSNDEWIAWYNDCMEWLGKIDRESFDKRLRQGTIE